MADLRELFEDAEEAARSAWAGLQKHMMTSLVSIVTKDSDGKTVTLQPAIKQTVQDKTLNQTTYQDFPPLVDVPLHFVGGGGVTVTHKVAEGDEHLSIFTARPHDTWFQSGGTQKQISNRMHSLSDAVAIPGIRSTPRALHQISTDSTQVRSDDKKHVIDHHPQSGTHIKSADPSTAPASESFDPHAAATKFFEHFVHPTNGVLANATDGGTTHSHGVTHTDGAFMRAANALHSVLAHPQNGASLNASNLLHSVLAHPSLGALLSAASGQHVVQAHPDNGVSISSSKAIALSAPSVSLPSGSVGGGALGGGAAASNVGLLGGDLSGSLPSPKVIGIGHVTGANTLPSAASDAAAASAGIQPGGLYRNTTILAGVSVLCVRMA